MTDKTDAPRGRDELDDFSVNEIRNMRISRKLYVAQAEMEDIRTFQIGGYMDILTPEQARLLRRIKGIAESLLGG